MVQLDIIYQDDYLMVIDKPAYIPVTNEGVKSKTTISQILIEQFGNTSDRGGVIHRLDQDTSGVLIVSKSNEISEKIKKQFQDRAVNKTYLALVHGFLEKELTVVASISRNPENRFKFTVGEEGREAVTDVKLAKFYQISNIKYQIIFKDLKKRELQKLQTLKYNQFSLIDCFPKTGRTHQIRVHLKYIGNPIVGDSRYTGKIFSRLDQKWCPRQFLHASKIEFEHPVTGKRMSFESPLPEDLKKVLGYLEIL